MITIKLDGKEYQIDIEQAKKLNLLKEKDNKAKSDIEFVKKYCGVCGYSYNITANMMTRSETPIYTADQLTPHEAKAIAAFSKLLKLRRDWIGEWEPDWKDYSEKFILYRVGIKVRICGTINTAGCFSFPTKEMVMEFVETFHDLIEEAKILI